MSKIIVIGGGPAGMFAAITAAEKGHKVVLIEKNEKLGKKLFITGKGRCNITNASDIDVLFQNVMSNRKFLYSAFYGYDNEQVIRFFESHGLPVKTERGNRVFPQSDHSSDVIACLTKVLRQLKVEILLHTEVAEIIAGEDEADEGYYKWGVTTSQAFFPKDYTEEFDSDLTIAEWLTQYSEIKDATYVRGFLGRMLFAGDDGVKKVRVLSGGEKVRCLLSKMMISGANVLVLDQPTNHLDMESIQALNNGLIKFPGVLLFTCHDHQFVQTTANRIMEFRHDGTLIDKVTTYDEYLAADADARKRSVYTLTEEDN